MPDPILNRSQAFEDSENIGRNGSANLSIADIIAIRFDRRDFLKGTLGVAAMAIGPLALNGAREAKAADTPRFAFSEVAAGSDETHYVAAGYDAEIVIRWGDSVLPGAPPFDPMKQTADGQKRQFGYNNDFIGYFPMPGAENPARHGLLVVNHEYTNEELMFPGLGRQDAKSVDFASMTKDLADIEKAAHGGSVLEVKRDNGNWQVVAGSKYARRIDADTLMELTGPAAGSDRLKTSTDPSGRRVNGMVNNCAGGITPWGSWLTCEENFHGYFTGKLDAGHREGGNYKRYGVPGNAFNWGQWDPRFDLSKEPNEPNRFGWIVEIDPFDPTSTPKKRTALGRTKHEGASLLVNKDGKVVVYSGDDERFDYVYKFVTNRAYDRNNPVANRDLLDDGILYVARYNADGKVDWLPLVFGQGPLTPANGFDSQADVLIETRRAGDLLGATKMDRPEDVEGNAETGKVFVLMTNNTRRTPDQVDAANPRAANAFGHIIEMTAPDGDHAATQFTWEMLVRCGDPSVASVGATFNPAATTVNGWFGMPDNCAIDNMGRLWIATDGNSSKNTGRTDGVWALETEGALRGTGKLFFRCPSGAELCGPMFTPDDETLFVAVQHPGESEDGTVATFENPSTRWPDFKAGMPPRPSVLAITKRGGGRIAT